MREHPTTAAAPMHLPTSMEQCEVPANSVAAVDELTELESRTREMGSGAALADARPRN